MNLCKNDENDQGYCYYNNKYYENERRLLTCSLELRDLQQSWRWAGCRWRELVGRWCIEEARDEVKMLLFGSEDVAVVGHSFYRSRVREFTLVTESRKSFFWSSSSLSGPSPWYLWEPVLRGPSICTQGVMIYDIRLNTGFKLLVHQ